VAFLERSLERRSIEAERYQQIVAGLTQTNNQLSARVLQLEAPVEPPASTESREVGVQRHAEAAPTPAPGRGGAEAQNGAQRPWWWRMFGG